MIRHLVIIQIILMSLGSVLFSQHSDTVRVKLLLETTVFQPDRFPACHASTIAETIPGTFMAAWFAGSYEGANDVSIWISSFKNESWSDPVKIVAGYDSLGNQLPCWNPVLFKTTDGTLILFYKVGANPREWYGMVVKSFDEGKNWEEPVELPKGFLGPIKNKPVQLPDGKILCPSSVETIDGKWSVHLEKCDSDLSDWERIDIPKDDSVGVIQPTILKHPDGRLQILCRSRQNFIYQSWSDDNGLHWSKLEPADVPNPNSGIDAVALDNGSFVLIYNPLQSGKEWWLGRNILNAAVSKDGINWEDIYQLENEKDGEFSYPAVISGFDKSIHITYTANRKNIKYVVMKVK